MVDAFITKAKGGGPQQGPRPFLDEERHAFEKWISKPPFEHDIARWPKDERRYSWPGLYRDLRVQLAWESWKKARGDNRKMQLYTLTKTFRFEAAHRLPYHDGKCARLHGHSFVAKVELAGAELHTTGPKHAMLVDYGDISQAVRPLLENCLDHHYLNETTGLESPTSELLAQWIFERLLPSFPGYLYAVTVEETCTSACRYCPSHE